MLSVSGILLLKSSLFLYHEEMHREYVKKAILTAVFAATLLLVYTVPSASAAELDFGSIRLDRLKENQSNVEMLVVLEPSTLTSTRTESSLRITFDSKFTLASAASITTSTSGLPATYAGHPLVAYPGLTGTAVSVGGQVATFITSDLSDGNYYAFFITSGISTTTTGKYLSTLETRDVGSIDSQEVAHTIVSDDQLTVSATVPADASDGDIALTADIVEGATLIEGGVATFTLSYRSQLSSSQPFELVASWEDPTYVSNPSQSVDVLEYVTGSASDTDNSVSPVINLQNRTITWDIPSLPPSASYHTVTFQLRVSPSLSVKSQLLATVHADATIISTGLPQDTFTFYILKSEDADEDTGDDDDDDDESTSATPTPAQGTSQPPTQTPFSITSISFVDIGAQSASIRVETSEEATITVEYGTNKDALSSHVTGQTVNMRKIISLLNLESDTQYFFRIRAQNASGETTASDLYTFRTALKDERTILLTSTVIWNNVPLSVSSLTAVGPTNLYLIPHEPITIQIFVKNPEIVKSMYAYIQPSAVLGINSQLPDPPQMRTQLRETLPGLFSGVIAAPDLIGTYGVKLEVEDIFGGYQMLTTPLKIYVSNPITIYDKRTGMPIEGAEVNILRFNPHTAMFEAIDSSTRYVKDSDAFGEILVNLPPGKYKVVINAPGYVPVEHVFNLDPENTSYPHIEIERQKGIAPLVSYGKEALTDVWNFLNDFMKVAAESQRIYDILITALIVLLSINFIRIYDSQPFVHIRSFLVSGEEARRLRGMLLWGLEVALFLVNGSAVILYVWYIYVRMQLPLLHQSGTLYLLYGMFVLVWVIYLRAVWRDAIID
jgi:hypothetical protein